ncbi:hypothetical protein DVA67_014960 [Solirubrobacter sp. CPCC 204708]|uniref:Uncharacterized protein n=1 Tax=Solirubrobacter deserti TaxID=2282478 RepID=A0ABT4RTY7_9ACTN|nr:hypothetical protein [Solirubrobacter deserti]MBE2317280.1 hypothetical protein [Solirubrobacter deserti]MDA0142047.1 hypothetical protein [Solirubrobacter deserti]
MSGVLHAAFARAKQHAPARTAHITLAAGEAPCAILMLGSPDPARRVEWIADELAAAHGASVPHTISDGSAVYGDVQAMRVPAPFPVRPRVKPASLRSTA